MILIYSTPSGKDDYFYRRYMQSKTIKVVLKTREIEDCLYPEAHIICKLKQAGIPIKGFLNPEEVSSGTLVKFYDVIKQEIIYEWRP